MTAAERRVVAALRDVDVTRGLLVRDLERAEGLIAEAIEEFVPRGMGVEVGRIGLEGEFVVCLLRDDEAIYHGAVYVDSDGHDALLVNGSPLADWVARVTL